MLENKLRTTSSAPAAPALGMKGMRQRAKLQGRCVKTMVDKSPNRLAR
ncbi:MAG: hypothetical protein BWY75_03851 [bacterium ADurb.Bin425]|nr:MAG: hypothetical protein BWY75_03851 [bacterium ADurb.Bin425]